MMNPPAVLSGKSHCVAVECGLSSQVSSIKMTFEGWKFAPPCPCTGSKESITGVGQIGIGGSNVGDSVNDNYFCID